MRRALITSFSVGARSLLPAASENHGIRRILYKPAPFSGPLPSRFRFFSSESGISDQQPQASESLIVGNKSDPDDVKDVSNKELKVQLEKYLHNFDADALPTIFESILKRIYKSNHEETDDELMEEFKMQPLDKVDDRDFESDFEDIHETDEEIDDLYNPVAIVKERMAKDPYFVMNDRKWDDLVKEGIEHGHLNDTREHEALLEDMLFYNKFLPDEIKTKVMEKFHELGDRVEKGELTDEEAYELFKEFEDQIVLECTELMKQEEEEEARQSYACKEQELTEPPGEGPVLRWQTRVVFSPGNEQWHPKNRKVKLAVTVKELGLSRHQFIRLRELAGKRYNPGKDELTITSERFEHREENRKDCLRTLFALIEEAGKARILVEDARKSQVKERLLRNPAFMQRLKQQEQAELNPTTTS